MDQCVALYPFLILSAIKLLRMNGVRMLKALRLQKRWRTSAVFILTTSKADEDKVAANDQHIAGYTLKESLQNGFEERIKLIDHYWWLVEPPH